MNMRNASSLKWVGLTVSLTVLAGCVINPYVKAPTAPKAMAGSECRDLAGEVVSAEFTSSMSTVDGSDHAKADDGHVHVPVKDGLEHAMAYALCTQRAMERKAGKYAWMNQGGALMLMHMAGLASYSGTRGGHNAQVAAMTNGGATFYGAQQYLYRKPREAIYWSGAEAVGCAITVTNRRLVVQGDEAGIKDMYERQIEARYFALEETHKAMAGFGEVLPSHSGCTAENGLDELQKELTGLAESVGDTKRAGLLSELDNRRLLAKLQLNQLMRQSRSARSDLIDVTRAIRLAVNRQLAAQQPDPAELAKLLTGSKLPALTGSAPTAKTLTPDLAIPEITVSNPVVNDGCTLSRNALEKYRASALAFADDIKKLQERIEAFTTEFNRIQADLGADPKSERPIEQCLHLRANTLRPFGVLIAQSGALKVAPGATARVGIAGGIPPFDIEPLTEDSEVSAQAKLNERGEYEFVITVKAGAKAKKVKFFATDDAGGSDMFTVEVVE